MCVSHQKLLMLWIMFHSRIFESISDYCETYSELIPLSFVLGFYISIIMQRWWDQYCSIPWPDPIAVYVSSHIHGQVRTIYFNHTLYTLYTYKSRYATIYIYRHIPVYTGFKQILVVKPYRTKEEDWWDERSCGMSAWVWQWYSPTSALE